MYAVRMQVSIYKWMTIRNIATHTYIYTYIHTIHTFETQTCINTTSYRSGPRSPTARSAPGHSRSGLQNGSGCPAACGASLTQRSPRAASDCSWRTAARHSRCTDGWTDTHTTYRTYMHAYNQDTSTYRPTQRAVEHVCMYVCTMCLSARMSLAAQSSTNTFIWSCTDSGRKDPQLSTTYIHTYIHTHTYTYRR